MKCPELAADLICGLLTKPQRTKSNPLAGVAKAFYEPAMLENSDDDVESLLRGSLNCFSSGGPRNFGLPRKTLLGQEVARKVVTGEENIWAPYSLHTLRGRLTHEA
jgi:hypothetical protein